jgi:hypothetical protein
MTIRLIVGSLLAALALMLWGMAFWAASPFMERYFQPLPVEAEGIVGTLKFALPKSGNYLYPYADDSSSAAMQEVVDQLAAGPMVHITYRKEGVDADMGKAMAIGLIHYFLTALIAGSLLLIALPGLATFPKRVAVVTLASLFGAVLINGSNPIWFHHPWEFYLAVSIYHIGAGLIAGLVLGAIIKPKTAKAQVMA